MRTPAPLWPSFDADERHLVHDEQGAARLVGHQGELPEAIVSHRFLAVDAFVDRVRGPLRIA